MGAFARAKQVNVNVNMLATTVGIIILNSILEIVPVKCLFVRKFFTLFTRIEHSARILKLFLNLNYVLFCYMYPYIYIFVCASLINSNLDTSFLYFRSLA